MPDLDPSTALRLIRRESRRRESDRLQIVLERIDLKAGIILATDTVIGGGIGTSIVASIGTLPLLTIPRGLVAALWLVLSVLGVSAAAAIWAIRARSGPVTSSPFRHAGKTPNQMLAGYPDEDGIDLMEAEQIVWLAESGTVKGRAINVAVWALAATLAMLFIALTVFVVATW